MTPQQAQAMLDKQIEILDSLRNATTRAVEFREWRQVTLTLIERLWPDQPARAQRFRRVPFSPASMRADEKISREAFERGCAEARRLLQLWSAEIAAHGLNHEAEAPRLAEAARELGDEDDGTAMFNPVGDLAASEDEGEDEDVDRSDEVDETLRLDRRAQPRTPQRAPQPQARATPPPPPRPAAPARPAPPAPRSQPPAPAPRAGARPPQPSRPAAPPPRAPEPPRGKGDGKHKKKRNPFAELLGLGGHDDEEEMGLPEFEPTLGASRAPDAPAPPEPPADPPEGEEGDNPLRRLLELELEALGQEGIEEHGPESAANDPDHAPLEIENNSFLRHTEGDAGDSPLTPGAEDEMRTLEAEEEDEAPPPPPRPAAPAARPATPARPAAPASRPAPPPARPQPPAARPQPPAAARPQAPARPAPSQPQRQGAPAAQRPQAPSAPARPATPPPRTGSAGRAPAPPPQAQRPAPSPPRPAAPQGQRPAPTPAPAARRPAPAAPPASKGPARPAGPLEVERFERPEPMPARPSRRRREDQDEDALADALRAASQNAQSAEHEPDDDEYDRDDAGGDEDEDGPGLGDVHMVSYVARTFINLAAEVDDMDIPETHQERVRLALLDLAHYLDTGNVTWSILRDAITLVMRYPILARQALPLLLPYIETAA
jgi:hypothetical protein